MFHTLMVLGPHSFSLREEKAGRDLGVDREQSSPAGILFFLTSRPSVEAEAEHGKHFHPDNLIWQNMVEIFISVGYAYICGELCPLKDPPASKTDESSVSPWI